MKTYYGILNLKNKLHDILVLAPNIMYLQETSLLSRVKKNMSDRKIFCVAEKTV